MKLAVYSDLHNEHAQFVSPPALAADIIVLAGDIYAPGHATPTWARRDSSFGNRPIVYVAGNHEFYGSEYLSQQQRMRQACDRLGVRLLDGKAVVIDGVRFLGCTLWTDFQLGIVRADGQVRPDVDHSMAEARRFLNDYADIRLRLPSAGLEHARIRERRLVPEDTLAMHLFERRWLEGELATPFDGPTVVVTHHAPYRNSLAHAFADSPLSAAYVSELPASFFEVPVLWVHGHTHTSFDYRVGNCRVVCNPRGYPSRWHGGFENARFDPMGLGIVVRHGSLGG